jgi:para-nitrobenzyl esterase
MACLRDVPVGELLDAYATLPANLDSSGLGIAIDGGFLPAHPRTLFDSGAFSKVPYLLGANSDEGTLFFIGATPLATPAEYTAALVERFGPLAPHVEARYPVTDFPTPQDAFVRAVGDATLVCSTYDVAARAATAGNRVYVYNFARVIPLPFVALLDLGAFHGAEIPYVFGSVPPPGVWDERLSGRMQQFWTSFADRGRNPRAPKTRSWPRFRARTWQMVRLNAEGFDNDVAKLKNFRRSECEFWSGVYELLE